MSEDTDWIDLLEGELDEVELESLERLLRKSTNDRRDFLRLSRLRDAIAEVDPIEPLRKKLEDPEYQKSFTEKVMKAIRRENRSRSLRKEHPLKIERDSSSS